MKTSQKLFLCTLAHVPTLFHIKQHFYLKQCKYNDRYSFISCWIWVLAGLIPGLMYASERASLQTTCYSLYGGFRKNIIPLSFDWNETFSCSYIISNKYPDIFCCKVFTTLKSSDFVIMQLIKTQSQKCKFDRWYLLSWGFSL